MLDNFDENLAIWGTYNNKLSFSFHFTLGLRFAICEVEWRFRIYSKKIKLYCFILLPFVQPSVFLFVPQRFDNLI